MISPAVLLFSLAFPVSFRGLEEDYYNPFWSYPVVTGAGNWHERWPEGTKSAQLIILLQT